MIRWLGVCSEYGFKSESEQAPRGSRASRGHSPAPMTDLTTNNFGLLIAYLIPGFVIVSALSGRSPLVVSWLGGSVADSPTVGGFLFITLAAVAAGMVASIIRWMVIDSLHHHTGIKPPKWDFTQLPRGLSAFEAAVDNHYRYYQAYANLLIALIATLFLHPNFPDTFGFTPLSAYSIFSVLIVLLFLASRDALRKYYERTDAILSSSLSREGDSQ